MTEQNTETKTETVSQPDILDAPLLDENGKEFVENADGQITQPEDKPEAKPEDKKPEGEEEESEGEGEKTEQPSGEEKHKKSGWARRRERYERKIEELEQRLNQFQQPQPQQDANQQPEYGEPDPKVYPEGINDINYIRDMAVYNGRMSGIMAYREAKAAELRQHQQHRIHEDTAKAQKNFNQKFEKALEKYPDLEDQIEDSGIIFRNESIKHAIRSADNVGEMLKYFVDNPKEAEDLERINPVQAVLKIGKLDAKLTPVEPKKEVSKMGKPVSTVGNGKPKSKGKGEWNENWTVEDFMANTSIHDLD